MVAPLLAAALPALIGAAGSAVGGWFGEQGKQKEIETQREFAQNGIRWKVEDAVRAGVHPVAALGASGASYSPVGLGGSAAEAVSNMGQDIGRAVDSTRTAPERAAYDGTVQKLTLTRMGLENDLLASQIAQLRSAGGTPPGPMASGDYVIPGQTSSGIVTPAGPWKTGPSAPAQKVEDEYGDAVSWVYGAGRLVEDAARMVAGDLPRARDVYRSRPVRGSQHYK